MTTTCDLNVDWNKCPNCVRFKERIEDAEEASRAASANLDRAYAEYREDVAAGRACIATPRQRAWSSYLDDLEMEQSLASTRCTEAINAWATSIHRHHRLHEDRQQASTRCTEAINAWATSIHRHHRLHEDRQQKAEDSSKDVAVETEEMAAISKERCTEAINAWATSIHRHHRLHEDRQQKAEDSSKDVAVETEEMAAISKDDAVDALVNIYGGHIDQWLEALRDRTHAQADADDVRTPCACAMCTTLDKDSEDTDTKPTPAERAAYFAARDHADDADTPDAPGRRTAVRIVAYDAHKGGCHEVDPTDVPVWLLDTPNTAIARDVRQATLQEIRTLIDDLIDGGAQ